MDPAPARSDPNAPETLLSCGRLDELYWQVSRATAGDPNRARERCFFAGIAATHLGLWNESREQMARWAEGGGHAHSGPRVSVVVDARGPVPGAHLASVAYQLYRPIEVVLVHEPGEPADSALEPYRIHREAPLSVLTCEASSGGWRASGLAAATGELVAFVDVHTRLYPHHIGHLVSLASGRGGSSPAGGLHRVRADGRVETLPPVGDRCQLLVESDTPLSSLLLDADVARTALGGLSATELDDDGEALVALAETAAFERTTLPTSSVEARPLPPAIRLARTAARFYRHLPRATTIGGAALHQQRVEHLEALVEAAARDVHRRARVVLVLASQPGSERRRAESRLEAVTYAFGRAGERAPSPAIDILGVDPSDAGALDTVSALCRTSTFDYLAVVDVEHVGSLEPGWLTGLVVLLESDETVPAALPPGRAAAAPGPTACAERLAISGLSRESHPGARPAIFVTRRRLVSRARFAEDADWWSAWSRFLRDDVEGAPRALSTPLVASPQETHRPEPPLAVLCYHRVVASPEPDPFGIAVSRDTFEAHLAMLAREFRVIAPDDLDGRDGIASDDELDPRPRVLVTLDDGYRDTYECAYPLLERHGIQAVLFATTGAVSREAPFWWEALDRSGALQGVCDERRSDVQAQWRWLGPAERSARVQSLVAPTSELHEELLGLSATWDMLREMELQGTIRVGSHTRHHSSLGKLGASDLELELEGSFADLERELGHRPALFAYPHGSETDVSPPAVEALSRVGCRFAFTTQPGVIPEWSRVEPGSREALTLPRVVVTESSADELAERLHALTGTGEAAEAPRKITVLSGVTANNLGDDAMLVATVRDLRQLEPGADITILAESPEQCATIARQAGAPVLRSLQCFVQDVLGALADGSHPTLEMLKLIRRLQQERSVVRSGGASSFLPPSYVDGFRALVTADGVVDCGGANLSAHWKSYFYEKCVDYLLASGPLSVLGQGIDPFEDPYDQQLLVRALAEADEITLRESRSAGYLEALGAGTDAATTGDDALTLQPSSKARRELLLRAAGVDPAAGYVAFQYRHYLDYEDDRYLTLFAMFVEAVARETKLPVVGVPMHFSHTDERDHLERVGKRLAPGTPFHVVSSHLTAADAKALFGGSELTFGISYHSAILALSSGVPYLGLYHGAHYEQKMRGLEALYDVSELAVAVHDVVPSELGRRARELLARRREIGDHLERRHEELVERVRESRRRFLARIAAPGRAKPPAESSGLPVFPVEPVSRDWGFDRGRPVDRYYIERFLESHRRDVRGRVLELLDDSYGRKYGDGQVSRIDVLDIDRTNPRATVVDDLTKPRSLEPGAYDCVLLTQTLPYIYACGEALANAYRALAPGGTLLVTVPSIIKYHREPEDHWRFTPDSLERLVRESCPGADRELAAHGNVAAAASFLYGMAVDDLPPGLLETDDPEYPLVLTARITRPESADPGALDGDDR